MLGKQSRPPERASMQVANSCSCYAATGTEKLTSQLLAQQAHIGACHDSQPRCASGWVQCKHCLICSLAARCPAGGHCVGRPQQVRPCAAALGAQPDAHWTVFHLPDANPHQKQISKRCRGTPEASQPGAPLAATA